MFSPLKVRGPGMQGAETQRDRGGGGGSQALPAVRHSEAASPQAAQTDTLSLDAAGNTFLLRLTMDN